MGGESNRIGKRVLLHDAGAAGAQLEAMEDDASDVPRASIGRSPLPGAAAAQGRPAARREAGPRLQRLQTGAYLLRHCQWHL